MAHESEPTADAPHPGPPDRARGLHDASTQSAAPTSSRAQSLPRGAVFGHYTIEAVLGEGGMGVVYRARQERPAREVALKVIRPGLASAQALRRFELEAEVLGRLQHPGIAQVFEAGTTPEGQPFFAMELVRGESLLRYADFHELTTRERLELFAKVCDAVQHAHTKGVIHRDLKPVNILVDASGQPKILDFGVARVTQHDVQAVTIQTDLGQIIGTVPYMSPEQIEGDPANLDTRSDVYALGVILYELLSGRMPYDLSKKLIHEAARIIQEDEPTRLSSINRALRGDIETIAFKALEKDKARRYQAASDLGSDITRFLRNEPIAARPASRGYQLRKFAKRNKALVGGVVAAFVFLAAGLTGTSYGLVRALAAEAETKQRADELQKVSEFQSNMLAQVDPESAGVRLTEDVSRRFAEAIAEYSMPDSERTARGDAFRQDWLKVNATDVALKLMDQTILAPASKAIEERFESQPVLGARLRSSLADTYRRLGLYQQAVPLLERVIEVNRREFGAHGIETLDAINLMGLIRKHLSELDQAERLIRSSLVGYRNSLGENHRKTLAAVVSLAWVLEAHGNMKEAEQCYRDALDRGRRILGDDDPDTLGAMNNLGHLFVATGQLNEAEPLCREVVDRRRRVLGSDHPETLNALNNMGQLLQAQGRFVDAEACLRETLERRRRLLGNEHPSTLISIDNMARLFQAQNRLTDAEPVAREAMEVSRQVLGGDHLDTLIAINNAAAVLSAQDKLELAAPLVFEALEAMKRTLGRDHPQTVICTFNYGRTLMDLRRLDEAEPYIREAYEKSPVVFGESHPLTPISASSLGMWFFEKRRFAETVALLAPIEVSARAQFSGDHARRFATLLTVLARARTGLSYDPERFALAQSNLLEAHTILLEAQGPAHKDTRNSIQGLVDLYTAWHAAEPDAGYDRKAAEWRDRLSAPATRAPK